MTSIISDRSGQNSATVVLGATGRLGTMLRQFWPGSGPVIWQSRQARPGFSVFDPILEPEDAASAMTGAKAVICLSGVTPARAGSRKEVFSRNTDLALAAMTAARKAGVAQVFLASSAAVYGRAGGLLEEAATCHPAAPYGQAKLDMEHEALAEADSTGQRVTALRIGNVAGADAILGGWQEGFMLDRMPDGRTPRRSYIGPRTLARAIHALMGEPTLPRILNLAAPGAIEMGALLDAAGLDWQPRPAPEDVIPEVVLSTHRLETLVPFAPEESTAAGMVAQWRDLQASA